MLQQNKKAIGYWYLSNTIAVNLIDIEYSINDYAIIEDWNGNIHKLKIYYNTKNSYIRLYNNRYYFNNCIKY